LVIGRSIDKRSVFSLTVDASKGRFPYLLKGTDMSRYKAATRLVQRDFERLEDAKRFIKTFPRGTVVKVTDMQAGPRDDTMTYIYISGKRACVQHGPLRTAPL
jgi:hypothetical protein